MAGDDSRALARPARTYGMNLGGFFAGVVCCLCKARPGTSARPHRRGKNFREMHSYFAIHGGRGALSEMATRPFTTLHARKPSPANIVPR
jgi:hypothetical protein